MPSKDTLARAVCDRAVTTMTPFLWLWKKSMRACFHTGIHHERPCLPRAPTDTPAGNSLGPGPARQRRCGQLSLLLAVCMLAAPGCTSWGDYWRNNMKVGPTYQRPIAPVEPTWIDADDPQVRSECDVESQWWRQFNDPVLDQLVLQAYEQNLTLREAGFRVLASRAAYNITVGGFMPQAQGGIAEYARWQLSNNVDAFENLSIPPFSLWQTGFNLSWELDLWGKIRRKIESAAAEYQASVEEYDGVLVTLIADVADRYVDYRVARHQVADLEQLLKIQRDSLQVANDRFEGGITSELDVSQARLNLAKTEALIPYYEREARLATNALCMLLGIPPEDLALRLGEGDIPTVPASLVIGIPAELIRRRPDVRQAERLVAAQCAQIGVAEAQLYPSFSINGYLGVYANEIGQLFESDSLYGFVAPVVDWKILNYGRLLNNIRQQDARFLAVSATYQQTVLRAGREAEDGIVTTIKARIAANKQLEAVAAASRSAELVEIQYKEGASDFNRVFVVQQTQVTEQIRLNTSVGGVAKGMIKIYRALGGGWQLRLDTLAASGQCCKPLPSVDGSLCDD
ncbi:MAG: efflux transporter outer membrane subunit [Planctomycetia bacterium]|nr:efflux transporter outer membrane subunit [Planctomycetia bacterium]